MYHEAELTAVINVAGHTAEVGITLCGNIDGDGRAFDLTFTECWMNKYFNPDEMMDRFLSDYHATCVDRRYDEYKDRELFNET